MAVLVPDVERHARKRDLAYLLGGVAAVIFALAVLIWVVWQIGASVKPTPFDADGVRCYAKADTMSCIKTANPG